MSTTIKDLVRINRDNAEQTVEAIAKAFKNYPLLQHYFPNESDRDKILPYFLSFPVYAGIKYGEVYASSLNYEGIAVWIPSDKPLTFWRILRSVPLSKIIGFGRSGASKMQHFSEYIDTVHQRLAPFKLGTCKQLV